MLQGAALEAADPHQSTQQYMRNGSLLFSRYTSMWREGSLHGSCDGRKDAFVRSSHLAESCTLIWLVTLLDPIDQPESHLNRRSLGGPFEYVRDSEDFSLRRPGNPAEY